MTKYVVMALVVLAPAIAAGQTHPCDENPPPQATIQSGAPHVVQFCGRQADNPEAMVALLDGTPFDLLPIVARTGPSTTGLVLYESGPSFIQVPKGSHTISVALYNRNVSTGQLQVGPFSDPLAFSAADEALPPVAPIKLRILKR